MSEAQLELNIREQVDSEAILREDMGDNPLITLFSGTVMLQFISYFDIQYL